MAKGSVRKKGKKWYYRFYVEDASGRLIQKEYVGTESKSETEKLLRKAMEEYESTRFVPNSENITLAQLLDIWAEEDLKTGSLSNGTVKTYLVVIRRLKTHPIAKRKLSSITTEMLQAFMDLIVFGGKEGDFNAGKGFKKDSADIYAAVLRHSFKFAVFPKKYIIVDPMQYVEVRTRTTTDLFISEEDLDTGTTPLNPQMYEDLVAYLKLHHADTALPVQISYYTGLRIGEVIGLTWQDINLEEQYLTVRRSVSYNPLRHKLEIGPTKRSKVRIVDFGDKLTEILKTAKDRQTVNELEYGSLYQKCYYKEVREKNRIYNEYYSLMGTDEVPSDYKIVDFVCRRRDGSLLRPNTLEQVCARAAKNVNGLEGFHFHTLRHTFTTNLLAQGAMPKDVQELLGHSDLSTTMNTYAHGNRESKRSSVKLLDRLVS